MISFKNDYSEGAHPQILEALLKSNYVQENGYGEDSYSQAAAEVLHKKLGNDSVDIHFLAGGTQTNLIAISAFLKPHEAAIAAHTGHIFVHETGAIEATGHKVLTAEVKDGKLTPAHVEEILNAHTDEHMVKPRLVYISNATEVGTAYSKEELRLLSEFCREKKLYLFMDGARLGSALCSEGNDLTLSELPDLLDAFYIGGTKNGALLGEALVLCNEELKQDFRYHMKQKGALLAKGRVLGIQFLELFRDNLFFDLAIHANTMAYKLRDGLKEAGVPFLSESHSNQIFPIFANEVVEELKSRYRFEIWGKVDEGHTAIRLVTSWATREEAVASFMKDIRQVLSA
ncbi:MAG TPA: aminotransferase class I/II-fold pyridoxal phosphate-dependent enzyme [Desulfitobacterium dehalogenans]|uniref:Aminotransferase class I/II-fold pyridoxal phosphate-dependent enzyme n=1 Tax=Desulfitobacterium dehalogenans TaxID=36854 RepID=A0A7C6Z616_9FIRM|nr:aminotransferase class I/II-fold pyridoxal phosphate-dependent enzyme [Desulfitobacterium dehalogenans]